MIGGRKTFLPKTGQEFLPIFLALVFVIYTFSYLSNNALPGNSSSLEGWWSWWDQSNYLKSARAFSVGSFNPDAHWYPPGYALLAAPLQRFSSGHAFFFVDAACLLIVAYCFIRICAYFGIGMVLAAVTFLLSTVLNKVIFEQFFVPWTTSPTSALHYVIILIFIAAKSNTRTWSVIGFLSGLIALFRPTDLVSILPIVLYLPYEVYSGYRKEQKNNTLSTKSLTIAALSGAAGLSLYLIIYLSIYGFHVSDYLKLSQNIGFLLASIPFKLYVLFIEPLSTYGRGQGILQRYPWIFLSLIGMVVHSIKDKKALTLCLCMLTHIFFYSSYTDLIPTGLWRFLNIHYFKWLFPLFGMFAWLAIKEIFSLGKPRIYAIIVLAFIALLSLLSIKLIPTTVMSASVAIEQGNRFDVGFNGPVTIQALDFPFGKSSFDELMFKPHELYADGKPVSHISPQPSPHFSCSEINALPLNGQQAVTAISALWLRRSVAFRWLQQPIGRHLMIDVVEQVIERHPEVKNEGIPEISPSSAHWKCPSASA